MNGESSAYGADRHHLHREPEPVVIPPPRRDQPPILIIQIAAPLQLHPGQHLEPPVAGHASINHADMNHQLNNRIQPFFIA
jgi:hypothetical protein